MHRSTIIVGLLGLAVFAAAEPHRRVHIGDISALTLRQGAYTTGRRSSPVPQLSCVSGSCGAASVPVIQCVRTGWDGMNPQVRSNQKMLLCGSEQVAPGNANNRRFSSGWLDCVSDEWRSSATGGASSRISLPLEVPSSYMIS